jgi:hypothetical protein
VFVFLCGQDEHWIYAHSFVSAPIYEQRQTVEALALIFGGGKNWPKMTVPSIVTGFLVSQWKTWHM